MPKPADKSAAIEVSSPDHTDVATKVSLTHRVQISPDVENGHPGVPTVDVRVGTQAIGEIVAAREISFARVYDQLGSLKNDLLQFFVDVPETLPLEVRGQLLNPDGSPAANVSVEAPKPADADGNGAEPYPWPGSRTITDARGSFALPLPTVPIPEAGPELVGKGSDGMTSIAARRVDLAAGGALGVIPLDRPLAPLPQNIIAALAKDVTPTSAD